MGIITRQIYVCDNCGKEIPHGERVLAQNGQYYCDCTYELCHFCDLPYLPQDLSRFKTPQGYDALTCKTCKDEEIAELEERINNLKKSVDIG